MTVVCLAISSTSLWERANKPCWVNETAGYTATISDVRLFNTFQGVGINTPDVTALNLANQTTTLGTSVSRTVVGTTINMRATTVNTLFGSQNQLQATLTIEGRDSGARLTIPVTVTKV